MTVTAPSEVPDLRHRLYTWAALGAALIVFAGFARTFYLKGFFSPAALSHLLLIHGVLMTLWFGLFIVQVRLVATGRTGLHRRLGAFGAVLFVVIVVFGVATSLDAARRGATPTPEVPPLVFLAIPLFDLLAFAILVGTALALRRRPAAHKRLMLLATLSILTPGIARIPLPALQRAGLPAFLGLTVLLIIACVVIDTVWHRRLHPAFGWGAALVIASLPLRLALAGTAGWMQFATWVTA